MIAPPFLPVPPPQYGGTELVVAELIDGLVARDFEVTLYASADSQGGYHERCPVRAELARAVWPPTPLAELRHAAFAMADIVAREGEFDVIHAHLPAAVALSRFSRLPMLYTIHHPFDREPCALYTSHPEVDFVAISQRQLELCGAFPRAHVVHHGMEPVRYRLGAPGDSVAFLGRLSRVKAPHVAIDVAARAGVRIRVAGRPHEEDAAYFARHVEKRLRQPHVEYLGEVGHEPKVQLLATSRALLFPIDWEEPFGLVMVEAMLCGCPVVAFDHGAVKELVEEGVTGFVARDEGDMVRLLNGPAHPSRFDRQRCRDRAVERFSTTRMIDSYTALYQSLAARRVALPETVVSRPESHA